MTARTHAPARLRERYAPRFPGVTLAKVALEIRAGKAHFVRHLPGGRTEWRVYAFGRRVRAVFDEAAKLVVTVLPVPKRHARAA